MTCIVGVEHAGGVIIGGDSAGTAGTSMTIRADQKVFRNGPYLFGFTSSFRMGQLLRHALKPPAPPSRDIDAFMVTTFIDSVRDALKEGGYVSTQNGVETSGTFMVGVIGKLFTIHSDNQVSRSRSGYDAIGCGDNLALGSMHTTRALHLAPRQRIRLALMAASEHNAAVAAPFIVKALAA